jgi:aspartokinase
LNKDLGAVTVRFGHDVLQIPNVTFEVLKLVALNNINIIEIVSTSQELTLVIDSKNVKKLSGIMQGRIG